MAEQTLGDRDERLVANFDGTEFTECFPTSEGVSFRSKLGKASAMDNQTGGSVLRTAAALDTGTAAAEVPTNGDLGSASLVDVGTGAAEVPTNSDVSAVGIIKMRPEPAGINLPAMPDIWASASGQPITDAESPFNGKRIYNYNGADVVLTGLTWTADAGGSFATVPEADRLAIGIADDVTGTGIAADTVVVSMDYETGEVIISDVDATGETDTTFTNEGRGAVGGSFGSVGNQMQRITASTEPNGRALTSHGNVGPNTQLSGAFNTGSTSFVNEMNDDGTRNLRTLEFDSANSPNARTSATTNGRTKADAYKAVFYVRIK